MRVSVVFEEDLVELLLAFKVHALPPPPQELCQGLWSFALVFLSTHCSTLVLLHIFLNYDPIFVFILTQTAQNPNCFAFQNWQNSNSKYQIIAIFVFIRTKMKIYFKLFGIILHFEKYQDYNFLLKTNDKIGSYHLTLSSWKFDPTWPIREAWSEVWVCVEVRTSKILWTKLLFDNLHLTYFKSKN